MRELLENLKDLVVASERSYCDFQLSQGVSQELLEEFQLSTGIALGDELCQLLRAMNGQQSSTAPLCGHCRFLSVEGIEAAVDMLEGLKSDCGKLSDANAKKNPYMSRERSLQMHWMPFASFEDFGYVFLDSKPVGSSKPTVFYWEFSGPTITHILATGIEDLIVRLIAELQHGGQALSSVCDLPAVNL